MSLQLTDGLTQAAHAALNHRTAGVPGLGLVVKQTRAIRRTILSLPTAIPHDNTRPQQSAEGTLVPEFSIPYVPLNAANVLLIEFSGFVATGGGSIGIVALFVDAVEDALAAEAGGVGGFTDLSLRYFEVAGSTSSRTYKIHCGDNSGTAELNSVGTATQAFNGRAQAVFTITEMEPSPTP